MARKTIDNVAVLKTPKAMMQAIDDNFIEVYDASVNPPLQSTGTSTTRAMSQKACTDSFALVDELKQVQVQGAATWTSDRAPYPANAQVYHNGKQWIALLANSVAPTEGKNWSAIGTAATRDVGKDSGNVMEVGAFGLGARVSQYTGDLNDLKTTQMAGVLDGVNAPQGGIGTLTVNCYSPDWIEQVYHTPGEADHRWVRSLSSGGTWSQWKRISHSGTLLSTTGQGTSSAMTQKAVTDALIGVGQTWQDVTGSRGKDTTYTNTTGKPIQLQIICGVTSDIGDPTNAMVVINTVIPPGVTYRLYDWASIYSWQELR